MLSNYFRIAIRSLVRHKGYSLINILGLTLGLATSLFIFLWVYDEVSFDKFHENIDNIYRVEQDQAYNNQIFHVSVTPYPSGEGWKQEIPEIEDAARFAFCGTLLCKFEDKRFYENGIVATDSTVFSTFTFPFAMGDPNTALVDPNSIVITHEMAEKYFGTEDPMGQVIIIDNSHNFMVTGVLKKIPRNSSLRFDFLVPFDFTRTLGMYQESWSSNSIQTFVRLNPNADPAPVDQKLVDVLKGHLDWSSRSDSPDEYRTKFMLKSFSRMHLHQYFGFNNTERAYRNVLIMVIIGIFILIIASINYMNLSTARSAKRAKEIGLRKVSGGFRSQIIRQFLAESLLTSFIAVFLAVLLVALLLDPFSTISAKQIPIESVFSLPFVLSLVGMGIFTGLIAGLYPALFLSGFKPVKVLYGDPSERRGKGILRKVLVIIQFTVSLLLIIGTSIVYLQNSHINNKDKGYTSDNVFYVQLFGDMNRSYYQIRDAFLNLPDVKYVSASNHRPGRIGSNSGGIDWDGKPEDLTPLVSMDGVDFNFVELLDIPVVAGRSFSPDYSSDLYSDSTGAFMINQTLERIIDVEDVIGMNMSFFGITAPIVGVMQDYHITALSQEIPPLAIVATDPDYLRFISVRITAGDRSTVMQKLESTWNEVMPEYPMEYRFLEDDFETENRARMRLSSLLLVFTIIAISIASLGLLGLSAFMAEKRTREIGVRKTMGSSNMEIIQLMVRQFAWLIIISMIIAIPISVYLMNGFLQDFAYRIDLAWYIFAIPAVFVLLIAVLTVGTQALKASRTHPAVCLRYE